MKAHYDLAHLPKDLINELRELVSEANTLLASSVSEYSAEALAGLRSRISAVEGRLSEYYRDARKQVIAGARATDRTIREHPYPSLAIALGVGVVVGVLLGRRDN